jgi:2-methylaconitate cis-trans-isomerase PrpF
MGLPDAPHRAAFAQRRELASPHSDVPCEVLIEHPSGRLTVRIEAQSDACNAVRIMRARVVLTTRPLFDGFAFPKSYRS